MVALSACWSKFFGVSVTCSLIFCFHSAGVNMRIHCSWTCIFLTCGAAETGSLGLSK